MKQLFNHITGRTLGLAFSDKSTDRKIYLFVKDNLEDIDINFDLNLSEPSSCNVSFDDDDRIIEVIGPKERFTIEIQNLNLIDL
jgi:hypothetical protein